jgi:hypothetical protein
VRRREIYLADLGEPVGLGGDELPRVRRPAGGLGPVPGRHFGAVDDVTLLRVEQIVRRLLALP